MTSAASPPAGLHEPGPPWIERDAAGRRAMLTGILAQVSREALQEQTPQAVLQRIVD